MFGPCGLYVWSVLSVWFQSVLWICSCIVPVFVRKSSKAVFRDVLFGHTRLLTSWTRAWAFLPPGGAHVSLGAAPPSGQADPCAPKVKSPRSCACALIDNITFMFWRLWFFLVSKVTLTYCYCQVRGRAPSFFVVGFPAGFPPQLSSKLYAEDSCAGNVTLAFAETSEHQGAYGALLEHLQTRRGLFLTFGVSLFPNVRKSFLVGWCRKVRHDTLSAEVMAPCLPNLVFLSPVRQLFTAHRALNWVFRKQLSKRATGGVNPPFADNSPLQGAFLSHTGDCPLNVRNPFSVPDSAFGQKDGLDKSSRRQG